VNRVLHKPADSYRPRGRLDPAGFEQHVRFNAYLPSDEVAAFIDHFWTIRWSEPSPRPYFSEEVMHRPYVDAFFSSQESGIQGTFRGKRTYVAAGTGSILGIRFRPGAFHLFWNGPMDELRDRTIDLKSAFPQANSRYIRHLLTLDDQGAIDELTKLVRAHLPQVDTKLRLLNEIITSIETDGEFRTVTAVAKRFNLSERWLQKLFQDYIGIGLKWLLQRHKLLIAAEQIREIDRPNWARIAYDLGYSSQQHFITDIKRVLGKTPRQYKMGLTPP
jgi:AraC-like DNA-binding protein